MHDLFILLCFSVRVFSTSNILDVSLALEVGYALMHWSLGSYISCHEFHRTSKRCCFLQCFFQLFGSGEPTGDADYRHRMGAQLGEVPESIDVDAVAEMFFLTWDSGFHSGRIFVKNGWRNKYPSTANITWRKEIQDDTISMDLLGVWIRQLSSVGMFQRTSSVNVTVESSSWRLSDRIAGVVWPLQSYRFTSSHITWNI